VRGLFMSTSSPHGGHRSANASTLQLFMHVEGALTPRTRAANACLRKVVRVPPATVRGDLS